MRNWQFTRLLGLALLIISPNWDLLGQVPERMYGSKFRESSRLLELAKEKMETHQYQPALELLDQSLKYRTDNIDAYFNRALVKEQIDDSQGAFTDYQIVLLLDSTYREAAFNRAKLRYKQGHYKRAIGDFNKILTMGSSGTQRLYFKGTPLNKEGEVQINAVTTTYSMEADIYNYLGLCHQSLEQHVEAIQAFNTALSMNPNDANYLVNRGLSYAEINQGQQAITDFRQALELQPGHPIAQYNLTRELETSGNLEIEAYDEIINENPDFSSAYVNRAMAKMNAGNISGALEDYDKAVAIDPHDHTIYINRALAKEKSKNYREALRDYNMALSLDPLDAKAYRSRSRVLFQLEEFTLALEDADQAISLEPGNGGAYFNRALIHRKLGNQPQTCTDLEHSRKLGVQNAVRALAQYCQEAQ